MKINGKYHKAFTILEMLITISIFSIIASITFTILTNFNQQLFVFRNIQELRNSQYINKLMFITDFDNAHLIRVDEGIISFESHFKNVCYRADEGFLYRELNGEEMMFQGIEDVEIKTYFKNEEMFLDGKVDHIVIKYKLEGRSFSNSYYKNYGADIYVNE